ncbi:hypothetical protein HK096_011075 [Nowakowskiella sp. JEL0078]|nr:hypothetical protein HK096_011075 [Nowakowskiella sp. JEL0078]
MFLNTESPVMPGVANTTYRVVKADFDNIRSWQNPKTANALHSRLPTDSSVRLEIAFNGNGILEAADPNAPLDIDTEDYVGINFIKPTNTTGDYRWPIPPPSFSALQISNTSLLIKDALFTYLTPAVMSEFYWVSHTFTHENLNNCSYTDATNEINYNKQIATLLQLDGKAYFSPNSMVTPQISGIFNYAALQALTDNNIKSIVGDDSRLLYGAQGPWYPYITTIASSNYAGYWVIPRSANEVYYDCSTETQNTYVYNYLYQKIYGSASTHAQVMDRESDRVLNKILLLHPGSYMFHQANLRKRSSNVSIGGVSSPYSLLQQWVEYLVVKYTKLVNWPLVSLKQDDLINIFRDRVARDTCGITISNVYNAAGNAISSIIVSTSGTCNVLVTIPVNLTGTLPSGVSVKTYANQPTVVKLSMSKNSITLNLAATIAVK